MGTNSVNNNKNIKPVNLGIKKSGAAKTQMKTDSQKSIFDSANKNKNVGADKNKAIAADKAKKNTGNSGNTKVQYKASQDRLKSLNKMIKNGKSAKAAFDRVEAEYKANVAGWSED